MNVTCPKCHTSYDDADRSTICPHGLIMAAADLAQKKAAIALMQKAEGKRVRFAHEPENAEGHRITAIGWNGMVSLEGMSGQFAPHLFVVIDEGRKQGHSALKVVDGKIVKFDPHPKKPFFEYLLPAERAVVDELEAHETVYAKNQPQYIPLRTLAGNTEEHPVLSRWALTPEQRKAIADGADIFLELLTFRNEDGEPKPLQPIRMIVADEINPDYLRHEYKLETQKVASIEQGQKVPVPPKPPRIPGTEVG